MTSTFGPCHPNPWPSAAISSSPTPRWPTRSTSCATSKAGCASVSTSDIRPSRWRAVTPAARSTTAPTTTTTRTRWSSARRDQRLLALQDPPRHGDSRGVGGVHPPVAQASRAEGACLGVRRVRCVVDDAQVEVDLRHVHALADRVTLRLPDLVARVEVGPRLHLDHGVVTLVVEIKVVAVLEKRAAHRDSALVVERGAVDEVGLHVAGREAVV